MDNKQFHLRYQNKVTIVTGGSRGIGFGVAKVFVQHGAKVVIADIRDTEGKLAETTLNDEGPGECLYVQCDLSKEEDVKRLVDTTIDRFERLDCLINNAGTHPPHMPIDDFSAADMIRIHGINVMGFFYTSKYCLPHLRKTKGNIINNASLVASIGQPGAVTYATTKGGVLSMTKALAIDEAEHQVRVNSFAPGNVMTPMWQEAAKMSDDYEKCIKAGADAQLMGRFGTIEECGLVCFFLAADATFCTGININVSGGAELSYGYKNRTVTS